MNDAYSFFLGMLRKLFVDTADEKSTPDGIDPEQFLNLSDIHELLPLCIENVPKSLFSRTREAELFREYSALAFEHAVRQIAKKNEFLTLILYLQDQGLNPVVIKGEILRNLYPKAYYRSSVDDDILILSKEITAFHKALVSNGFEPDDPSVFKSVNNRYVSDLDCVSEISYHKPGSALYIELHTSLFPSESEVYGEWNLFFDESMSRSVSLQIEDVIVRTLAPTDHLLYLILHAFKHFVHSGIGIRAVCDIGLFAEHYTEEISSASFDGSASGWEHIRTCLEKVHAFDFTRGVLHIVKQYLLPEAKFFSSIGNNSTGTDWHIDEIDAGPLLEDILASGVHGNSSLQRLHSSNITLKAIAQDKQSNEARNSSSNKSTSFISTAFHSAFLPLKSMSGRYPYLKKAPFLLPFAWIQRLCRYLKEQITAGNMASSVSGRASSGSDGQHKQSESKKTSTTAESIRLGRSRVELLKKYGIIR